MKKVNDLLVMPKWHRVFSQNGKPLNFGCGFFMFLAFPMFMIACIVDVLVLWPISYLHTKKMLCKYEIESERLTKSKMVLKLKNDIVDDLRLWKIYDSPERQIYTVGYDKISRFRYDVGEIVKIKISDYTGYKPLNTDFDRLCVALAIAKIIERDLYVKIDIYDTKPDIRVWEDASFEIRKLKIEAPKPNSKPEHELKDW